MRMPYIAAAVLLVAAPLAAQNEDALRDAFEGKTVVVKLDMPATAKGVDIEPGADRPLDYTEYAKRLKDYGTAVKAGTPIMVTKVRVKKDLIEFQLGGGGFGTFWDDDATNVYVAPAQKTRREKDLEKQVKAETNAAKREKLQQELDDLRKAREREDAANRAAVAIAEQAKRAQVREQALSAGSRFNIRYDDHVPASALTPDAVRAALADYVGFDRDLAAPATASPVADVQPRTLRKGLTQEEVEALYGEPRSTESRKEGSLHVTRATYVRADGKLVADFVEGVLVRYTLESN